MVLSPELKCPNCGGSRILHDPENGEDVCTACGQVLNNDVVLDRGPESGVFTPEHWGSRPRTGMGVNPILFDKGMTTSFSIGVDSFGKPLNGETFQMMSRLRCIDTRSKLHGSEDRNLSIAMAELSRMADKLKIPGGVKTQAALFYRRALEANMIRGRSIEAFVAACLYVACRGMGVPRKLSEISRLSPRDLKEISRVYRLLVVGFNLKVPVGSAVSFVPAMASKLGLSHEAELAAGRILEAARKKKGIDGKDPTGIAGAALYLVTRKTEEHRTQKEIAIVARVTEVTLRNRMKGLEELLG